MIGTVIIAVIGYGLACLFAYEFVAHGIQSIFVDVLRPGRNGGLAFSAAICCLIVAAVTRWLVGGQF